MKENSFKLYFRLISYIKPYIPSFIGSILVMLLFNLFLFAQVALLRPFLRTIFGSDSGTKEEIIQRADSQIDSLRFVFSEDTSKIELLTSIDRLDSLFILATSDDDISLEEEVAGYAPSKVDDYKNRFQLWFNQMVYGETPVDSLWRFCVILIVIMLLKNISQYLQSLLSSFFLQSIINDIRKELFAHIHRLSLAYFHKNKVGNLVSRVTNDVQRMQDTIAVSIADLVRDPVQIIGFFVYLLIINWRLTVSITVIAPVVLLLMTAIGHYLRRYSRRSQVKMAGLNSILQENFSGIRLIKGFGKSQFEVKRFSETADSYLRAQLKMIRVNKVAGPLNEIISTTVAVVLLWYGGKDVLRFGDPSPAEFVQYILILFLVMQPLKKISNHYAKIQQGLAAAERVFHVLDTEPVMVDKVNAVSIKAIERDIKLDNLGFRYQDADKWALKDIDLLIQKGQTVALVGHSGAGKSTLADLIVRFYDPTQGRILIDGIDIRDIEMDSLRNCLGIVTQETILFNETIAYNIAYGEDNPDKDRIIEAARTANALSFIEKLPNGIDSGIGDRGVMLSGGERQRLAIARAVYRNPDLLIFDEATSSLDTESEKLVQGAIDKLLQNRTALIIAHRLSTIINAHRIVVLKDGHIVETGTHEELLAKNCHYRELYNKQFS